MWNPDGHGKSVVRVGYGMFYDRTLLGTIHNFLTDSKVLAVLYSKFPGLGSHPGPATGRSRPIRSADHACKRSRRPRGRILNSLYPPGSSLRKTGTVSWDDPDRQQPYLHQISVGYERESFRACPLELTTSG